MKRIVLLGSTGSIGQNVLDVIGRHPEEFQLVGLAARRNVATLRTQCAAHPDARIVVTDSAAQDELRKDAGLARRSVGSGAASLSDLIRESRPDLVVNALVGIAGLEPTIDALGSGIPVAIANKEAIVTGGEILLGVARQTGAKLIPIDSEHVAIAQCMRGERGDDIAEVILTASGGALRDHPLDGLDAVGVEEVLKHPTWRMGAKITVDSATLVNKGLEVIEGHWLFGLSYDKIDVIIHPQSIVHSLVRFVDGSIIAQLGEPDMRLPILYALSYPRRVPSSIQHDVADFPSMTFSRVEAERYPCFDLVMSAARAGGNAPTVLNAANEVAVSAFLGGRMGFAGIRDVIDAALGAIEPGPVQELSDIYETDAQTRRWLAEHYPAVCTTPDTMST